MNLEQYRDINRRLGSAWNKCQYALDMAGIPRVIDEMSVLLSPEDLEDYVNWSKADDGVDGLLHMQWFNRVDRDHMQMEDIGQGSGAFQVRFEFFRPRVVDAPVGEMDPVPWRVEAMAVLEGYAPLHGAPLGRVVHASYKLPDLVSYEAETNFLRAVGIHPVAFYRNSYGRFSYWHNDDFPWGAEDMIVMLKPRVNLRDASTAT